VKIAQYEEKFRNYLGEFDHFPCEICGKPLKAVGSHLIQKHGITVKEYAKKYPLAPTISFNISKKRQKISLKRVKESPEFYAEQSKKLKSFSGSRKHKKWKKYSRKRLSKSRISLNPVNCLFCGKLFKPISKRQSFYCSAKCYHKSRVKRIKVKCEWCGKIVEKKPYEMEWDHHFCSISCAHNFKSFQSKDKKFCEFCGKKIERIKSRFRFKHNFCSRECYNNFRRNKI